MSVELILWVLVVLMLSNYSSADKKSQLSSSTVNLPFSDVNVVVLTDVHSWVASHIAHEPGLNDANYGDVLSFYEQLVRLEPTKDFFFVMNGDFMDGTGLSTYPPSYLTRILQEMPWNAVNIGNHELYRNETVSYISQENGFIDYWKGNYLTSNVLLRDTMEPLGNRYTYLYGKNANSTILTFGFLFNFTSNCAMTVVEPVQEVVQAEWFQKVLSPQSASPYDAILVLAHMDHEDPLVYVILHAIRQLVGPDMPVQFITGHSHIRAFTRLDAQSTSFEAGHYLDTIGFASFPLFQPPQDGSRNGENYSNSTALVVEPPSNLFHHIFLDATLSTLHETLNLGPENMTTPKGAALSHLIRDTQEKLGLFNILGCASESYYLSNGLDKQHSLWGLYVTEVLPWFFSQFDAGNETSSSLPILVESSGGFRYSLLEGSVTRDDVVAVAPFNDTYFKIAHEITGVQLKQVLGQINVVVNASLWDLPDFVVYHDGQEIHPQKLYDLYTVFYSVSYFSEKVTNVTGAYFEPQLQHLKGAPVTTQVVWSGYVQQSMPCRNEWRSTVERTSQFYQILAFLLAVLVALVGWRCRKQQQQRLELYEGAATQDMPPETSAATEYNSIQIL